MVEYLLSEELYARTYDLCEVGAHPFIPSEDRPHICGAFPLTEGLLRQLVPENGLDIYAPFATVITDILEWHYFDPDERFRGPMAPKPKTLQDLLNAGRCCVNHVIGSSAGPYFLSRLAAALRDHGLDWRSSDGHYWHARTDGGRRPPELKLRQVYASCVCYRSSWQPCSRVLVKDEAGNHVPFLSVFHGE